MLSFFSTPLSQLIDLCYVDSWIQVTEKSGFPPAVPPLLVHEYDGAGPPAKQLCILNQSGWATLGLVGTCS